MQLIYRGISDGFNPSTVAVVDAEVSAKSHALHDSQIPNSFTILRGGLKSRG